MTRFAAAFFACLTITTPMALADSPTFPTKPDILETIQIKGEIDQDMWQRVGAQVKAVNTNPRVKAVLIVVDSPGGGVTASEEIREEFDGLKVPAVAFCNSMCASGGMYILMSKQVKFIALRDATIAGSIGVFAEVQHYDRLLNWAKIDTSVFKSGDPATSVKDAGDPSQPMSDADAKFFQNLVNDLADRFWGLVTSHRKIADVTAMKTATVFIGAAAVREGLADAVMTQDQAEEKAKELSGSKAIYTKDEMQKMAQSVSGDSNDDAGNRSTMPTLSDNLNWMIGQARSMLATQRVTIKYELPYRL